MKKLLITLFLGIATLSIYAQETDSFPKDEDGIVRIFTKVEKEAKFPGGLEGWRTFLEKILELKWRLIIFP